MAIWRRSRGKTVEFLFGVERFGECRLVSGPGGDGVVVPLLSGDNVAARESGESTLRVGVAVVEGLENSGDGDGARGVMLLRYRPIAAITEAVTDQMLGVGVEGAL